jgi:hypothetical protein
MKNSTAIKNYKSLTWNCFLLGLLVLLSCSVFALTTNNTTPSSGVYNGDFEYAPLYVADTNVNGKWNAA